MDLIFQPQPMPLWDWRVAADLFFGGMGVGGFLFALIADWHFKGTHPGLSRVAARMSPFLVILGLLFLMSEVGRPFSFYKVFFSFNPASTLWWGAWLQTAFVVGSLAYAKGWNEPGPDHNTRVLGWALSPIALAVGAYHGFLLAAFEVRSLWSTGATVVAALLGFVTTGIAGTLVVYLWLHRRQAISDLKGLLDQMHEVRNILGIALMAQTFVLFIWFLELQQGNEAAVQALTAANEAFGPLFWGLGIGLGLLIPLGLGLYVTLFRPQLTGELELRSVWVTSSMILLGGFVIRLSIVLGGQAAPLQMNLG